MASIMTNTSAMTALQTLRRVTGDLETTQDRISTGLKVNNAKDNAAYWSIATTMKADVAGFKAVKESLELGSGTTNTASVASKNIVENLQTLKARVIAGQTNGVDKSLIQNDVDQLVKLIKGAAADASFNGDNLLRVTYSNDGTAKDKDVSILASLSRSDGAVDPSYIEFQRQDMRVEFDRRQGDHRAAGRFDQGQEGVGRDHAGRTGRDLHRRAEPRPQHPDADRHQRGRRQDRRHGRSQRADLRHRFGDHPGQHRHRREHGADGGRW